MKSRSIQRLSGTLCKISKLLNIVSRTEAGPSDVLADGLFFSNVVAGDVPSLLVNIHMGSFDKRMLAVGAGDKVVRVSD